MAYEISFRVNSDSPVAPYLQIKNNLLLAIASGELEHDEMLPPLRKMADTMKMNINTVAKAYRELQLLGLIHSKRGVGFTVLKKAPQIAKTRAQTIAKAHLMDAVAECLAAGMMEKDIQSVVSWTII